jgi:hypothetical protein
VTSQAWLARRSHAGLHRPSVSARVSAAFFSRLDDLPAPAEVEEESEQQSATNALKPAQQATASVQRAADAAADGPCNAPSAPVATVAAAVPAAAAVLGQQTLDSSAAHCRAGPPDPGCSRARPYMRPLLAASQAGAVTCLERASALHVSATSPEKDVPLLATADAALTVLNGPQHAAPAESLPGSRAVTVVTQDIAQLHGTAGAAETASAPVAGPDGTTSSRALPWPHAKRVGSDKPQDSDTAKPPVMPAVRPCTCGPSHAEVSR